MTPEPSRWDRFAAKMAALGLDPLKPIVGEDHPHFEEVRSIIVDFGGVAPLPPLPPNWEGHRPVDYDGTINGVARWLEFEWRQAVAQSIFPGAGETSLAHLNEAISNTYRAFAHFQIADPPKREARAATIEIAKQRIETLMAFMQATMMTTDLPTTGKIAIEKWSDLGIGIDENDSAYYAFVPCPGTGQRVRPKGWITLPLEGAKRWPKVLACLARSNDGKMADKEELALELGYYKKGDVSKAAALGAGMTQLDQVPLQLKNTMSDLARELRDVVVAKTKAKVFRSHGDSYIAAFTTRHLFRDEDGNITFGRVE